MDDQGVGGLEVEHGNLDQRGIAGGPDELCDAFIDTLTASGVADGVPHVFIGDPVLAG
jgi:hypothetical protein